MTDEDDDVVEMVTLATFPAERVAKESARKLIEAGVGATVERNEPAPAAPEPAPAEPEPAETPPGGTEPVATDTSSAPSSLDASAPVVPPPRPPEEPGSGPGGPAAAPEPGAPTFALRVLPVDVERACAVLDIEPPGDDADDDDEVAAPPWKRMLLVWLIAMLTIPPLAGLITYYLIVRSGP